MVSLDEAIYERYISKTRRERTKRVGLEFELPVINLGDGPVDFAVVHEMTDSFIRDFAFGDVKKDDDGFAYSAADAVTGDAISFDCSYNTLEFSFGTSLDLNIIKNRFDIYYTYVQNFLGRYGHALTGMGINPHYDRNISAPVVNERYRMLFHHLCSYRNYEHEILFHDKPNFGLFSCASQIQLDAHEDGLTQVLNTFTKLEPLKALILANSVWGSDHEVLCSRDNFWRNSLHGLNRHNVDMYAVEFGSVDEIVCYIRSMSIYCVMRDGRYVNFHPTPLQVYFASDEIEGEYFDGSRYTKIWVHPRMEDLEYLRSFKFEDLTFRGTVEFRSVCEQPVSEIMASGALHAGLMENVEALDELLADDRVIYRHGYNASELRRMFVKKDLPQCFDWKAVSGLIIKVLDLAADGLKIRGYNEGHFLDPLYIRAERLLSPGREMAQGLEAGQSMDSFIERFGRL